MCEEGVSDTVQQTDPFSLVIKENEKLLSCKEKENGSTLKKKKSAGLRPKTIYKQGDGFTHIITILSRATKSLSRAGPTQQCCHSQFKTTACSSAHLDGQILSAYIIRIRRAELVGQCLGPRDKWRTFQMTGAGQP